MSQLSKADQTYLSQDRQAEIAALKQAWADAQAAGDQTAMEEAHRKAEAIRNAAGYSGGADGSGAVTTGVGGKSAEEVQKWVDDYRYTNLSGDAGWINGFSADMNVRSMANFIRQQMEANSNAWADADTATRAYLHDQNLQLARILENATGGAESTYNEKLGRWETANANLGYGYNVGAYNDDAWYGGVYGMTPAQQESYRADTARYRNYVDQDLIRNRIDESSGYTGIYSQFVNGPYAALLAGERGVNPAYYTDLQGDGFYDGDDVLRFAGSDGEAVQLAPRLRNNNDLDDYTRQFTSYVDENGVIQPGLLLQSNPGGGRNFTRMGTGESSGQSGGDTGSGLDQWYAAALQQTANREDYAVDRAVQQLLLAQQEAENRYRTQRNQITGDERNALDNAALYAETRGDRGGIGQAQYNSIQATADANRQAVNSAQTKLSADTARQVAELRAEGEFNKADSLLELAQTYLLKLLELEKWAAEYELDTAKFQQSVYQWQQEFALKAAKL